MKFFSLPTIDTANRFTKLQNYAIMYMCFALGGVPFFYHPKSFKVAFLAFLIIIFFTRVKGKIDTKYISTIIFLFLIFALQVLTFGAGGLINFGYIFMIVTIPYLALKIVGPNFLKYFINITYFFAIVSLGFYIASSLSPSFYYWTSTLPSKYNLDPSEVLKKGFIIYTWERAQFQGLLRNPGPFWEPSAYANYLNLAIIFQTLQTGKLINRKNVIFILALLTTFSTGGYAALFIVFASYVVFSNSLKKVYRWLLAPALFIVIYISYIELAFLGDKVSSQYEYQTTVQAEGTGTSGRFLGARKSLIAFSRYPIQGRGLIAQTAADSMSDEGGGYGFVSLLMRLGIFGFILWLMYLYRYPVKSAISNGQKRRMGIGFFLAILASNFGQAGYDKPMYLMVFYGGLLGYYFLSDREKNIIAKPEPENMLNFRTHSIVPADSKYQ
jgi:hypothetical protein